MTERSERQERRRRRSEVMGSWLEGPTSIGPKPAFPGERLGLPQSGPGSVATLGKRISGTLVDLVVSVLIGGMALVFNHDASVPARNLVAGAALLLQWLVLWPTTGQTIGMRVVGIRMVGRDGRPPQLRWVLLRALLMLLPVPFVTGVTLDADNRGVHDKASGVSVLHV